MSNPSGRAVLLGLVLFALAQVVLAQLIVCRGLALRDPAWAHKVGKLQQRLAGSPRPLLVVQVGSSRTVCGLRGQVAEPWLSQRLGRPVVLFNMGVIAAGPACTLMTLRRLLDEGVRPDLVLIEILPAFLTEEERFTEPLLRLLPARRLRYSEMRLLARHAPPDRWGVQHEWWQALFVPVHGYRQELLAGVVPVLVPPTVRWEMGPAPSGDESGWVESPQHSPEAARRALALVVQNYGHILRTFQLSPARLDVLRETIAVAHREGLAAALVLMPEGPIFRSLYPPAVKQQIDDALLSLSRDSNTPLLDLSAAAGEEAFFDSHHLFPEGASRFTHSLARRIEPLLHPEGPP
jgi:hypothetical protein